MPIFGGIFVGRRFGAFDSTPAGGRVDDAVFPPAGSYNSTLYSQEYPAEEGGQGFAHPVFSTLVLSQTCDVDVLNDGSGGTYIAWQTATNIQYKPSATNFYLSNVPSNSDIEITTGSGNYYTAGSAYESYSHDGNGWYYQEWVNQTWYPFGTVLYFDSTPVDDGAYVFTSPVEPYDFIAYRQFPGTNYNSDGAGGYYAEDVSPSVYKTSGTFIGNQNETTEVPSGSTNYYANGKYTSYYHDGAGSYYFNSGLGEYTPYGEYINTDGTYNYYWDGNGGYYSESQNQYPPYGTLLNSTFDSDALITIGELSQTVVGGTVYLNEYADGAGGSYFGTSTSWYGSGTQLIVSSGYEYIADGTGGYSQVACSLSGTYISSGSNSLTVYITEVSQDVEVGSESYDVLADGNCGTYTSSTGTSYHSYGTLLITWNDGTGDYGAYSDGYGGYYVALYSP